MADESVTPDQEANVDDAFWLETQWGDKTLPVGVTNRLRELDRTLFGIMGTNGLLERHESRKENAEIECEEWPPLLSNFEISCLRMAQQVLISEARATLDDLRGQRYKSEDERAWN